MQRRKRLNVTRRAGKIYFRRETKRLHDGTPDGEILWVMSSDKKPRKVSFVTMCKDDYRPSADQLGMVWLHLGTYRSAKPVQAAKMIRNYLFS
jgi:hypothetical protein